MSGDDARSAPHAAVVWEDTGVGVDGARRTRRVQQRRGRRGVALAEPHDFDPRRLGAWVWWRRVSSGRLWSNVCTIQQRPRQRAAAQPAQPSTAQAHRHMHRHTGTQRRTCSRLLDAPSSTTWRIKNWRLKSHTACRHRTGSAGPTLPTRRKSQPGASMHQSLKF